MLPKTISKWLLKRLAEQTTHSAIILAVILLLAARAAGIDLIGLTRGAAELLTALSLASAAAKMVLPETPAPPPPLLSEAATSRLERKAVEEGDAR